VDAEGRHRSDDRAGVTEVGERGYSGDSGDASLEHATEGRYTDGTVGVASRVDARRVKTQGRAKVVDEGLDERDIGVRQRQVVLGVIEVPHPAGHQAASQRGHDHEALLIRQT